jgi:hypothetical protein
MPFVESAKNAMLDSLTLDRVRLHSGDPGAAGTDNALGAGLEAATFAAASAGERALSADVDVTGLAASQSVTWFSVWTNAGTVFRASGTISSGDVNANAAGEFSLTTATKVSITDS